MDDSTVAAAIGAVVTLQENDYQYGAGPLTIRIYRIDVLRLDRGWAVIAGTQIDYRGMDVGTREVTVRVQALVRALPSDEG